MGLPHLVLLPGLDGTGDNFAPLLEALGPQAEVTVVGYPIDRALDFDELVAHARDHLPEAPHLLVGESFSGPVAMALAAEGRCEGLVLVATFCRYPAPIPAVLARLAAPVAFRVPAPAFLLAFALTGGARPEVIERVQRAIERVHAEVLVRRIRLLTEVDASEAFAAGRVPVLYLRATADRLVPPANLERLRALRPELAVASMDTAHLVLQLAPDEALQAIQSWWGALD